MPQWLGMPPRPPCQRPLHTSCDPKTILQVYPSSEQSTQPYSSASPARSLSNAQQKGVYLGHCYFLSPPLNLIPPRLLSWGPCKASTWPGPAGASHISSPTSLQLSTPCLFEITTPSRLPPTFSASFPGSSSTSCHSWTPGRIPIPGRDDSYSLLRSLGFFPALHSCSSQGNERLLTHKSDHIPQLETPNSAHLTGISTNPASGQQALVLSALTPFLLSSPLLHPSHPTMLTTILLLPLPGPLFLHNTVGSP